MKKIIITIFLTVNLTVVFGQDLTIQQKKIVSDFIDCVKKNNKSKIGNKISYPFRRAYPIPSIKNKEAFLKRYNEVFDDQLRKMIVQSEPVKDWSAVGWRGIMLHNGDVWLDYDGRLLSVNYQSAGEAKKQQDIIKQDQARLHESIQVFKKPVQLLETAQYRIRIDDMGNGHYRYASWKLLSKMSDKPDIVILNGTYIPDGSGGNHSFKFTRGAFIYECDIVVMGEQNSPPAYLKVYKGNQELLSQKAKLVNP